MKEMCTYHMNKGGVFFFVRTYGRGGRICGDGMGGICRSTHGLADWAEGGFYVRTKVPEYKYVAVSC